MELKQIQSIFLFIFVIFCNSILAKANSDDAGGRKIWEENLQSLLSEDRLIDYIHSLNDEGKTSLQQSDRRSMVECGSVAVASLMTSAEGKSQAKYTHQMLLNIRTLRATGYTGDFVVLVTSDVEPQYVDEVAKKGAIIKMVERIEVHQVGVDASYRGMMTKYHLWNLSDYDRVLYYDSDHIYLRNPTASICRDCSAEQELCVTLDTGVGGEYFNAGFLALKPSRETYQMLLANKNLAESRTFAEQDALNDVFRGKWKKLSKSYSVQCCCVPMIDVSSVIAVHGKVKDFKEKLPNANFWIGPIGKDEGPRVAESSIDNNSKAVSSRSSTNSNVIVRYDRPSINHDHGNQMKVGLELKRRPSVRHLRHSDRLAQQQEHQYQHRLNKHSTSIQHEENILIQTRTIRGSHWQPQQRAPSHSNTAKSSGETSKKL